MTDDLPSLIHNTAVQSLSSEDLRTLTFLARLSLLPGFTPHSLYKVGITPEDGVERMFDEDHAESRKAIADDPVPLYIFEACFSQDRLRQFGIAPGRRTVTFVLHSRDCCPNRIEEVYCSVANRLCTFCQAGSFPPLVLGLGN